MTTRIDNIKSAVIETVAGQITIGIEGGVYMVREMANNRLQVGWSTDLELARQIASDNVRGSFGRRSRG